MEQRRFRHQGRKKIATVIVKNIAGGRETTLSAGGLFVAIGHEPNTSIFKGQLELDDRAMFY